MGFPRGIGRPDHGTSQFKMNPIKKRQMLDRYLVDPEADRKDAELRATEFLARTRGCPPDIVDLNDSLAGLRDNLGLWRQDEDRAFAKFIDALLFVPGAETSNTCGKPTPSEKPRNKPVRKKKHKLAQLKRVWDGWIAFKEQSPGRAYKKDFFEQEREVHGCESLNELMKVLDRANDFYKEASA